MSEIDLHVHSTASDGTKTPEQLIQLAKDKGLKAIAITDHDTCSGLAEGIAAGKKKNIEVIPGCELSIDYPQGQMHILGLWLSEKPGILTDKFNYLRGKRHSRNERIVAKLQGLGLKIDYQDVKSLAQGESVGRPHIAQVLLNNGHVQTIKQAFDEYIGPKGKAYLPKEKLGPEEAIKILRKEQATVILAHPFSLELTKDKFLTEIKKLIHYGLDGIEVYYSEHSPEQTQFYLDVCKDKGLLCSGGSDFHGEVKPHIDLGTGKGNLNLSYSLLELMKKYRKDNGLWIN